MEEFLIGTGIGLLLALIGWSEQIRSLHRETLEAEKDFSKKRKIEWSHVRKIIRGTDPARKKIIALNKLLSDKSVKEIEDVKMISKFYELDKKRINLENLSNVKYGLLIALTFLFFISGVINYFTEPCYKIKILGFNIPAEFIPIMTCICFAMGILCFVVHLNSKDGEYRREFIDLLEKI